MNELDKTTPDQEKEVVTPCAAPAADTATEPSLAEVTACDESTIIDNPVCAESQSPAEAISEATDAIEGADNAACDAACDSCAETESPAEAISEATDAIEGADTAACDAACDSCAETESPAEAISEATDAIEGADTAAGLSKYHSMTKEELVEALDKIVSSANADAHKDVNAIKQSFYIIRNREDEEAITAFVLAGNTPEQYVAPSDPLETRLKELTARFREMRAAHLKAEEERRATNLERRNDILAEMRRLTEDIDNANLNVSRFKELQQQFREIKEIPAGAETDSWKNFQLVGEQFYDCLKMNKSLRDLDFKKNLEAKEELIKEAEGLADVADVLQAFRTLQTLHARWRELGPVAKERREEIWNRFKEASTAVNRRHQEFFETRKAAEQEAEAKKIALCERVEAIDIDSIKSLAKWDEYTKIIIDTQKEWKEAGFASRRSNNQLFTRFRKSCDEFFTRKADYYKATKKTQNDNLAKKIDLCERAEALAGITDLKELREKTEALMAEWKTVGSVSRRHSDSVWQRFNKACSIYYEMRKKRSSDHRKEESANLAAKREIIEKLKALNPQEGERREIIDSLRELQNSWQSVGHVPFKAKDALNSEYREVVDSLYETLNVRRQNDRLSGYQSHLDRIGDDSNEISRARRGILRAIDEKKAELKTVENNLGFFNVKSSAGSSLLSGVTRQIDRIKEEIATLEQKLQMLDSKANQE